MVDIFSRRHSIKYWITSSRKKVFFALMLFHTMAIWGYINLRIMSGTCDLGSDSLPNFEKTWDRKYRSGIWECVYKRYGTRFRIR